MLIAFALRDDDPYVLPEKVPVATLARHLALAERTVRQAIAAGKTADEAAKTLQLPERYKDYDMRNAAANVRTIYTELKK